jgi:hypothetical protein
LIQLATVQARAAKIHQQELSYLTQLA